MAGAVIARTYSLPLRFFSGYRKALSEYLRSNVWEIRSICGV
jgi:hypothetical protein